MFMTEPSVGIVVPVYNGAEYLCECLASIVAQTHSNWQAVVVNNSSTDGTGAIADEFARRDARIRVAHCAEFLDQAENYNRAVALAPQGSRFIKIVEADNVLMPEALHRLVEVADSDPQIGIVGGYYLKGLELMGSGVAYDTCVLSGREVCRIHLLKNVYLLGTPTTLLFRAESLLGATPVFRPGLFYDDVDLCFRVLRRWDFGFVHQIVAFLRVDNGGLMTRYENLDFVPARQRLLTEHYGADCLTPEELQHARRSWERIYRRYLGRALVVGRGRAYWEFHAGVFHLLGRKLRSTELFWPATRAFLDLALNPKSTCESIARRLRRRKQRTGGSVARAAGQASEATSAPARRA